MGNKSNLLPELSDYKDVLVKCDLCNDCLDICPIYQKTQMKKFSPLAPVMLGTELNRKDFTFQADHLEGLNICTLCGRCVEKCPPKIDLLGLNLSLKKTALKKKLKVPGAYELFLENMNKTGNIYGINNEHRIDVKQSFQFDEDADFLIYLGCMNAFEPAIAQEYVNIIRKKSPEATGLVHAGTTTPTEFIDLYNIMKHAGLKLKTLGEDESCCGWPAYVNGNEVLFKKMLKKLAKNIKKANIKTLVTPCAMCYYILKEYLPRVDKKLNYNIIHATDLILELFNQGKIEPIPNPETTTYHEGCYLGRYSKKYDEPREIIKKIAGDSYIELNEIKKDAKCCGGSINFIYPDFALWIGKDLMDEAKEKKIKNIVNTCPLCIMNIKYSAITTNADLNVLGISSYTYENIKK